MAHALEDLARIALAEDAPDGDITSRATIPEATRCEAELVIKRDGVLAGLEAAIAVFEVAAAEDGTTVEIDRKAGDGDRVPPRARVREAHGAGPVHSARSFRRQRAAGADGASDRFDRARGRADLRRPALHDEVARRAE